MFPNTNDMNHSVLHLALPYMFFETTTLRTRVESGNNPVGAALSGVRRYVVRFGFLEINAWTRKGGYISIGRMPMLHWAPNVAGEYLTGLEIVEF